MTPEKVKKALDDTVNAMDDCKWFFSANPKKDNTRNRKFPFKQMISSILAFQAGTLNHEIMNYFGCTPSVGSASAFVQQRAKILPQAFEYLFQSFTEKTDENKLYHGYRLLAVDGSDLKYAADSNDPDAFFSSEDGQKAYNMLHINAMYDLIQHTYVDATVQKRRNIDEAAALTYMVDTSPIKRALLIADRGYESYNNFAHIQEKGWAFLIRVKDKTTGITSGLVLPSSDSYDISFHLKITRRCTKTVKNLLKDKNHYKWIPVDARLDYLPKSFQKDDPIDFYDLHFRVVHFPISDTTYETIITNLDTAQFPINEIKRLYAMRWGIETSFRDLKYTLGLLHLHSKKVEFIYQEIFAKLTMYNFCELITQSVVIHQGKRKLNYKVNFSDSVHICREFFLGKITPPNIEALLIKFISPIRPGRNDIRKQTKKVAFSFLYRVA